MTRRFLLRLLGLGPLAVIGAAQLPTRSSASVDIPAAESDWLAGLAKVNSVLNLLEEAIRRGDIDRTTADRNFEGTLWGS